MYELKHWKPGGRNRMPAGTQSLRRAKKQKTAVTVKRTRGKGGKAA